MGMCKECLLVFPADVMKDGYCPECLDKGIKKEELEKIKNLKLEELKNNKHLLDEIYLTTETMINESIEKRLGLVSSQCVYGINLIKDIFSFVKDIVGGRVNSIEKALENANNEIIRDLKIKAYLQDANAVIGVRIEHTYNNANAGSILSVFATGTVVVLSNKKN